MRIKIGNRRLIAKWYYENGVPAKAIRRMRWFQKNYNFFRDLMDTGWDREHIIRIVRYMLAKKIWDWRNIPSDIADRIGEKLGVDANKEARESYGLFIAYDPHITVVRTNIDFPTKMEFWKKHEGEKIQFVY